MTTSVFTTKELSSPGNGFHYPPYIAFIIPCGNSKACEADNGVCEAVVLRLGRNDSGGYGPGDCFHYPPFPTFITL